MKRFILIGSLCLFIFGFGAGLASVSAQPYPNRPVQMIVPGTPGLMQDISCRVFTDELAKIINQQIVVLNKAGASNTLGTDFVIRAKKDGYTLLYAPTNPLIHVKIFNPKSISYNAEKDLEPLGGRAIFPFNLVVREDSPWKTFPELIDYAKKNPGKIRIATPGLDTVASYDLEIIQSETGAQFTLVPMQGGPAISLLGGHIEGAIVPITETRAYVDSGRERMLLVSNKLPDFPKVPTLKELGYKQDILLTWFGFYAPSGVPDEVKKVMIPAIEKCVKLPQVKTKIEKINFILEYVSPAEQKKLLAEEYQVVNGVAEKIKSRK